MSTTDSSPKKPSRLWRILFRIFFGIAFCLVALFAFCAICLACKARNDVRWLAKNANAGVTPEQLAAVTSSLETFQTQVVTDYNLLTATVNEQSKLLRKLDGNSVPGDPPRAGTLYRGTCTNLTHALSAPLTITFDTWADGKITGVLRLEGSALTGDGKFEGVSKDNRLSFTTRSETVGIAWNGVLRDGRLVGAYVVSTTQGKDAPETGVWTAEAVPAPAMPEPVDAVPPGV